MFLLDSFSQNSGYFSGDAKSTTRFAYSLTAEKKSLSPGFILAVQNPEYIWPANYIFVHDDNVALKFRYEFNFLLEKGFLEDFFGADDIRLYSVVVVVAFSFVCFFFQEAAGLFRNQRIWNFVTLSWNLTHTPNHKTRASSCNA